MAILTNGLETVELGGTAWRVIYNNNFVLLDAALAISQNQMPIGIYFPGYLAVGEELDMNLVAPTAFKVNALRIACINPVEGGDAILRVQVGSGSSPTKYMTVTVTNSQKKGENIVDNIAVAASDLIILRATQTGIGNFYLWLYTTLPDA